MGRPSKFDASYMAKLAIEALQEKETLQVLAKKYGVAPSKIDEWKENQEIMDVMGIEPIYLQGNV